MAGVLPMSVERIIEVNNLPKNMVQNALWGMQHTIAIERLRVQVTAEYMAYLESGEAGSYGLADAKAGEVAFGLYTYYLMMPCMNLHTVGKGFVKRTGIEDNATELLKPSELSEYRLMVEKQALESVEKHLSEAGRLRLRVLNGRQGYRVSLIGERA
jgi:hypothetical protein